VRFEVLRDWAMTSLAFGVGAIVLWQPFHMSEGSVQPQIVALRPEATYLSDATGRGHGGVTKALARVDVGQVDLDRRDPGGLQGVADRDAGVGVGGGVDDERVVTR